jgi:guanylate kinase
LVGKSGSGKNTVQDYLVKKYGLKPLLSYTTRARRYPEEDTHTFITEQEYEEIKKKEKIIAYTFYNGNHYFATEKQFAESDIYIIDIEGIRCIKELGIDIPYIIIYLDVPAHIRMERMARRNDNQSMIDERIKYDEIAFKDIKQYSNHFIPNFDSEQTAVEIAEYLGIAKCDQYKLSAEREIIDKLCQIQTLVRRIHPSVHDIRINMENCFDNPLEYRNNYIITGAKDSKRDTIYYLSMCTSDEESGNAKYLKRAGYKMPNEFEYSMKTTRIR